LAGCCPDLSGPSLNRLSERIPRSLLRGASIDSIELNVIVVKLILLVMTRHGRQGHHGIFDLR
jgi:hypothetical protein